MIEFSQMVVRLLVALLLGALVGFERELAGKEAGIRTSMMVAGGSAIFALVAMSAPALIGGDYGAGALHIIANIVVGIGFLGTGIIIKTEERIHGLTTAAVVWTTAAIGVLAGIGFLKFATVTTLIIAVSLYGLRKLGISEKVDLIK